jgi:3-dehydroquinate synthase
MRAAADLAVLGGHLSREEAEKIRQLLTDYGMETAVPAELDRGRIKDYLQIDKKTIAGRVFFVLPTEIGKVIITDQVDKNHIDEVLVSG